MFRSKINDNHSNHNLYMEKNTIEDFVLNETIRQMDVNGAEHITVND